MAVQIVLNNLESRIIGFLPENVQKELNDTLSYSLAGIEYSEKVKNHVWDGVTRLYREKRGQSFLSGLFSLVVEVLKKNKIEYTVSDARIKPNPNLLHLKFSPPPNYEEREYQQFAIERAIGRTRGIFKMATGSGKTMTVAETIGRIQTGPFMFYVTSKDLLEQAYDVLSSTLNEPIGKIGGGICDIKMINVATIQTAVKAINLDNVKFKISDYSFDEEDAEIWRSEDVGSIDRLDNIRKVIQASKGAYLDECVSGDAIIHTEKGNKRLEDVVKEKCRCVLTYDGNSIITRKITNWWDKGTRKTLVIKTHTGKDITCTPEHLIFTQRGWIEARNLTPLDYLLIATADVEQSCLKTFGSQSNLSSGIKRPKGLLKNGFRFLKNMLNLHQFANVDAAELSSHAMKRLKGLYPVRDRANILNSYMVTTNNQFGNTTILNQQKLNSKRSGGHCSETLACASRTGNRKTQDCHQPMGLFKKNGFNTNQISCTDLESTLDKLRTKDMEIKAYARQQDACLFFITSITNYILTGRKLLPMNFLTRSEKSDLLGGFAMTEAGQNKKTTSFTPKGGAKTLTKQSQGGLTKMDMNAMLQKAANILLYILARMVPEQSPKLSRSLPPPVCGTSWSKIESIESGEDKKVFDIEVEGTHCFFANGILVHNCHHSGSTSIKDVITASPNCFWKFGGSATPYREDNADLMIQALFGRKIVDINASYLIEKGYLCEPYIIFDHVQHDNVYHGYKTIYKNCVADNLDFNGHVANTAKFLIEKGLTTLILVQQYNQGELLKTLLPNTPFITGKTSDTKRQEAINDLRNRKIPCMIATTLADEGLDIPTLDAALLAGGGASATRVNQRIGRTLRIDRKSPNPRRKSLVIYYRHKVKYLNDHALKAKRIMKEEPKFNIIESKSRLHLNGEIEKALDLSQSQHTLFS